MGSKTNRQTSGYNKEFERVQKAIGFQNASVRTKQPESGQTTTPKELVMTPEGYEARYLVNPTTKKRTAYKVSTEAVDEAIRTGGRGKYADLAVGHDFSKQQSKDMAIDRKVVDNMTKVTYGSKTLGTKAVQKAMKTMLNSINKNTMQKQYTKRKKSTSGLLSGIKNTLVNSLTNAKEKSASIVPKKKKK